MNRATRVRIAAGLLALTAMSSSATVFAQDCSSTVSNAQNQTRTAFIQGMSGLVQNNFSTRPASFTSMACLSTFMNSGMDIMFTPPSLTNLLGTVMNFACQGASGLTTAGAGASATNINSLLGPLAGGLNIGGSNVNLSQILTAALGGVTGTTATGSTGGGGLTGLYTMPGSQ